jgi:hypothetical protein
VKFISAPRIPSWCCLPLLGLFLAGALRAGEIWRLDNLQRIGGHAVTIEGAPRVVEIGGAKAIGFDGARDGLFVPSIPFAGAKQFTIEVMFSPAEGGLAEQRFLHVQDTNESRALIEVRLNGKGGWWLDTYQWSGGTPTDRGLTLIDPRRVHPTGKWYWAALRYDGRMMAHFVNGEKEIERAGSFRPFGSGQVSLGVRQNKVFWFKGAIREVRFHSVALAEDKLQRGP